MKIFNDNGKVIFDGAFDVNKIDFNDKATIAGDDFFLRYNDKDILNPDMSYALYDFMSSEWKGNDDTETIFYLFVFDSEIKLSVFCKPLPYEESDFLPEDVKVAMNDYEYQLQRLSLSQSGYETTCFDAELTDTEKQQLKKSWTLYQ